MTASGRAPRLPLFTLAGAIAVILVLLFPISSAAALDTDPILTGEFWVEMDPFVKTEESYPLEDKEAYRRILEEARYVFSGMIYGFSFVYTPLDRARNVEEIFRLDAAATIPWGDPALTIAEARTEGNLLVALVRYIPSEHQIRWLRMMESNVYQNATANGSASLFLGHGQKIKAISEAAKEVVRAHLRPRVLNKPKEVRGKISFSDVPYIIIDGGEYTAKVSARIDIDKIVPYRFY